MERTTDLVNWTPAGADVEVLSTAPTGDGVTEEVRARLPIGPEGGNTFVRVRVVMPD